MTRLRASSVILLLAAILAACGSGSDSRVVVVFEDATFAVAVESDIKYGEGETRSGPNVDLLMDIYSPIAPDDLPRPAMLIVHGGAWIIGDKTNPSQIALADFYASRGFVVFAINYRMVGNDPVDAPQWWVSIVSGFLNEPTQRASYAGVVDAATAVRFIRANAAAYGVSPDHVFAEGSSAGAFNIVHLGLDEQDLYASTLPVNNLEQSDSLQLVVDRWGGSFRRATIDATDPPVLILHGTEDTTVPFVLGQLLDQSLTDAAVPHQFVPLDGWGHSAWAATVDGQTLDEIALEFIAMHGNVTLELSQEP